MLGKNLGSGYLAGDSGVYLCERARRRGIMLTSQGRRGGRGIELGRHGETGGEGQEEADDREGDSGGESERKGVKEERDSPAARRFTRGAYIQRGRPQADVAAVEHRESNTDSTDER